VVSELNSDRLTGLQQSAVEKDGSETKLAEIISLVGFVRDGNFASLAKARQGLGITLSDLSALIGVSENTLNAWEREAETPSHKNHIAWKLKFGSFIEEKIAGYLGTTDPELIHQFWESVWRLNDL
jgi:DNA-binding XRE family transcriptional regulator